MKNLDDQELQELFKEEFESFESETNVSWENLESKVNPTRRIRLFGAIVCIFLLGVIYLNTKDFFHSDSVKNESHKKRDQDTGIVSKDEFSKPIPQDFREQNLTKDIQNRLATLDHNLKNSNNAASSAEPMSILKISDLSIHDKLKLMATPAIGKMKEMNFKSDNKRIDKIGNKTEWLVSSIISYNTAYFIPLDFDNIQIERFSQSKNIFDNRLGISMNIKMRQRLKKELTLEYFAGINYLHKHFEYSAHELTKEGGIQSFQKMIDGSIMTGLLGGSISVKNRLLPKPLWLSLAYQQTLASGELNKYFSSNQIRLGIGIPIFSTEKFEIVPQIGYSIPLTRNYHDFQMNTIMWGVEVSRRLKK